MPLFEKRITSRLIPNASFDPGHERKQYEEWTRGIRVASCHQAVGLIAVNNKRLDDVRNALSQLHEPLYSRVATEEEMNEMITVLPRRSQKTLQRCRRAFLRCIQNDVERSGMQVQLPLELEAHLFVGPYAGHKYDKIWHNDGESSHGTMRYVTTLAGPVTHFSGGTFCESDFMRGDKDDSCLRDNYGILPEEITTYDVGTVARFSGNAVHKGPQEWDPARIFISASVRLWEPGM